MTWLRIKKKISEILLRAEFTSKIIFFKSATTRTTLNSKKIFGKTPQCDIPRT